MQQSQLQKLLVDLGLSANESRVYLASLGLGATSILKISRSAELKRTTVYSVVESLIQKGLMRKEVKGMKQYYCAESPDKLETVFEEKRNRFKKAFPELLEMYNFSGEESFIKHYEGLIGMKTAYLSMLEDIEPHDEYLVIANIDNNFAIDENFFRNFFQERAKLSRKRNFSIRILLEDTPQAHEFRKWDKNHNQTTKLIKANQLPTHFVLTPHRVLIHQTKLPITAIVIENRYTIQTLCGLFDIIWNSVKA